MKVYMLSAGENEFGPVGIYSTPEAAMAAYEWGGWTEYEGNGYWYSYAGERAIVSEWEVDALVHYPDTPRVCLIPERG
jgi:hypothetical protein